MEKTLNQQLIDFIDRSPSPYHAIENVGQMLRGAGYTQLSAPESWILHPGRYYVTRNGSSLIAFELPEGEIDGCMITAAHCDSPSFKLKESAEVRDNGYVRLSVEKYGGMLCAPWLDRPLSIAGRIVYRDGEKLAIKNVNVDKDLLLIPNLAIHMDRSANDGKSYDAKTDMLPLMALSSTEKSLDDIVAQYAQVPKDNIISRDLQLYPREKGRVWGAEDEFISAPRLDDLQCVFSCLTGLIESERSHSMKVLCVFDNEEVGSTTKQGANSNFLDDTLHRVFDALGKSQAELSRALSNSFMISADNAHAVHPNHPEYADRLDRPLPNSGIVIKFNAQQRYCTDSVSAAVFSEICRRCGVPTQRYSNRADLPGGSTLGNISSSHVSIDCVDIGLAQLAMHSCYETAGAKDTEYLARAAREFYSSDYRRDGEYISF